LNRKIEFWQNSKVLHLHLNQAIVGLILIQNNLPFVSVLVPSYERHQLLVDTVKGLVSQKYEKMEIIIYDQSLSHPPSIDRFLAQQSNRIRHIKATPEGLISAYRQCVELANGDVCIFVDDDVLILNDQFIKNHVKNYSDPKIGAVCGQILHENRQQTFKNDRRVHGAYGWRYVRFTHNRVIQNFSNLAGANMSFRKKIYWEVGGFDCNYIGSGFRFETDFSMAIRQMGYHIIFDPKASLVHRYGSPGGAGNRALFSTSDKSHSWYQDFFSNTWYFLTKWYPLPRAFLLMGYIWREHVFNPPYLKTGIAFQFYRNLSLIKGIHKAKKAGQGSHYHESG